MSDKAHQLKERVRLLQQQLELKRSLLKKAEIKSSLSKARLPTHLVVPTSGNKNDAPIPDTNADPPLLQETASATRDPRILPDDVIITDIPVQLDSPVLASCASLVLKTISFAHLLCLLLESDELVLYLITSDHAFSGIVWRKRIATHSVRMLRVVTHPDPCYVDGNAGVILAQQFHMTDFPVFSLFLFNCPTSTPFSAVQLLDATVTSLPPCPPISCSDAAHVASHVFGSASDKQWLALFFPTSLSYAVFELLNPLTRQLDLILHSTCSIDLSLESIDSTWSCLLSACSRDPTYWTIVTLHSNLRSCEWFVHSWEVISLCSKESRTNVNKLLRVNLPVEINGKYDSLVAQQMLPVFLDDSSKHILFSIIATSTCNALSSVHLFMAVMCDTHCFVLRIVDLVPSATQLELSNWFLRCSFENALNQLLIELAVINHGGQRKICLLAWPVGLLLDQREHRSSVNNSLCFRIPTDFHCCILPTGRFGRLFSRTCSSSIVFYHDVHSGVVRILDSL
ncbi:hypothetical protein PHET_02941 [Paragonimus heterotremus]|uniref:Uncharacterized protein n=1 Tax=Paragonimus heterotremus TaxID=100268 RepID=A0A8J4TCP3_9TREM|nr:hypothetical protein PHET_02941 [Paragonimus heterotremus]